MGRGKPFRTSLARLVNAGVVPRPTWMDVVESTRPPFQPVEVTKAPPIRYPEDRLRSIYFKRYPDARRIPVNLKASSMPERHISDRFVSIQMRLMEDKNLSEEEAFNVTDDVVHNRNVDLSSLFGDDLSGPLTDPSISNETARLYMASVKDSLRDRKLYEAIVDSSTDDATEEKEKPA